MSRFDIISWQSHETKPVKPRAARAELRNSWCSNLLRRFADFGSGRCGALRFASLLCPASPEETSKTWAGTGSLACRFHPISLHTSSGQFEWNSQILDFKGFERQQLAVLLPGSYAAFLRGAKLLIRRNLGLCGMQWF